MDITVIDSQESLAIDTQCVKNLVSAVTSYIDLVGQSIEILFVTPEESGAIHEEHFDDPSPTDCMTFPLSEIHDVESPLGSCVICPEVALQYSIENAGDPYQELSLYIVHTLLHMKGMIDTTDEGEAEMRKWESLCINELKTKNLLLKPPHKTPDVVD